MAIRGRSKTSKERKVREKSKKQEAREQEISERNGMKASKNCVGLHE
jgi:hypothetical protein